MFFDGHWIYDLRFQNVQHSKIINFINEKKLAEKRAKSALADIEQLTTNFNKQQENKNRDVANLSTLSKNELKVKIFEFKGKNLSIDKINQAIKLSEEKYCGVWTVYKQTMEITKEVKLLK